MLTAVDSSVLVDILTNDATFGASSLRALHTAASLGTLVLCPIVWAEMRGSFTDVHQMETAFAQAGLNFDPFDRACADLAGARWREYRAAGGTRDRLIADFFIGAHAHTRADRRLVTRDRGFYRRYFSDLTVIDASPD